MTDVYEDRVMETIEDVISWLDRFHATVNGTNTITEHKSPEHQKAMSIIRAYINDPGYERVPEIGSHDMNELSTDFIYSFDDDDLRGKLYESRCVKKNLHAALLKLSASKGEK